MKHHHRIIVNSSTPPTVEFDGSVSAWYVRFSSKPVARTLSEDRRGTVVTIDLDAKGQVVGVELIGVRQFTISMLQKLARVETPRIDMRRARFVSTQQAIYDQAA